MEQVPVGRGSLIVTLNMMVMVLPAGRVNPGPLAGTITVSPLIAGARAATRLARDLKSLAASVTLFITAGLSASLTVAA